MKNKKKNILLLVAALGIQLFAGCGMSNEADAVKETEAAAVTEIEAAQSEQIATASESAASEEVVTPDMIPITADQLYDGEYKVEVDSSSSMFKITSCKLTVENGQMTAVMTMGGTGYLYIYMGTGEDAVLSAETDYIPFIENASGEHTYTIPVEALDAGINCTAFSKKKEKWYDRVLVFRADSLPDSAFREGVIDNGDSLELADGEYSANVTLEGGSGRTGVDSPVKITVTDGQAYATLVWNSTNYDYMIVENEKYLNENTEGNSTFTIPVLGFNYKMPVIGDTTAMSTPHEIEYTLYFELVE